jgi:hypothetical protein
LFETIITNVSDSKDQNERVIKLNDLTPITIIQEANKVNSCNSNDNSFQIINNNKVDNNINLNSTNNMNNMNNLYNIRNNNMFFTQTFFNNFLGYNHLENIYDQPFHEMLMNRLNILINQRMESLKRIVNLSNNY